jgi:Cof subfamily protein (haloacid dehalogenase superfamily)
MNKKLLVLDLDGTLLNSQMELTAFSREILAKLISNGHTVILASGRPVRAILPFYQAIGTQAPLIAYNGILVKNPSDPSFPIQERTFSEETIRHYAERMGAKALSFFAEGSQGIFLKTADPFLAHYFPLEGTALHYGEITKTLHGKSYAAVFSSRPENDELLKQIVESEKGIGWRHWSHCLYSEAYFPGVNKGSALAYLLSVLHFAKEDVYAFGDRQNDEEMLSQAGHPFAVFGCKTPTLLEKYPVTEKSNDHDGVALTLQKELL